MILKTEHDKIKQYHNPKLYANSENKWSVEPDKVTDVQKMKPKSNTQI